jgi:chromosome segregation ATPase
MKPVLLAVGLFVAFLLVRNTFTMSAQGTLAPSRTVRVAAPDTRVRNVAALEAQEQALTLRQQQIESEMELTGEMLRKVQNQIERLDSDRAEDEQALLELAPIRTQIQHKKADLQVELDKLMLERRRVQEEWTATTGLRTVRR